MANSKSTTTKKKAAPKKTASKKPAAKKTAKKPATKKTVKKSSSSKSIPAGLRQREISGTTNLDKSRVVNKAKRKKKGKKGKVTVERVFWIVVAVFIIGTAVGLGIFVMKDYNKDRSTPAQLNVPKITKDQQAIVEGLTEGNETIEKVEITEQGPIIYVVYTVPAGTSRDDIAKQIGGAYAEGVKNNAKLFETYSFQITVVNSGDEAEGVDDFPLIGSINAGRTGVSWMSFNGNFEEPVEE